MTFTLVPCSLPFRWRGKEYQIGECGMRNGVAFASTSPDDPELIAEVIRRLERDHSLDLYIDFGFCRFKDEYPGTQA